MPPPISMMLFAFVMSLDPLWNNVCRSTSHYCGGRGRVWDWFLATPGVGCNCFRRGILRHRMSLERHTRSPDTDAASFSWVSAPFTLHARSGGDGRGGWRLSPAALTSLRATGRMCRGLVRRYRWLLSNINHPFTELSLHWPVTQLGESCRTELWHSGLSLQSKHSNVYRYLGYLNTNLKLT